MPASSLLALIDDIASILDDVSVLTKVAAKKTAGVLGDDLALNAEQVTGVDPDRELPVVWAVAKGSVVNKLILVPSALAISALLPIAVVPLLMLGGAFLAFEGFEKVVHKLLHGKEEAEEKAAHAEKVADESVDLVASEKDKIKGAVRTDFILSAEIIVISLGTVVGQPLGKQVATLVAVSGLMTVGVYGLVAGIVKLDDAGLALSRKSGSAARALGRGSLRTAPLLMKFLGVAGTVAMFLVGGGILVHGIPPLAHFGHELESHSFGALLSMLLNGLTGIVAGALILGAVTVGKRLTATKAG